MIISQNFYPAAGLLKVRVPEEQSGEIDVISVTLIKDTEVGDYAVEFTLRDSICPIVKPASKCTVPAKSQCVAHHIIKILKHKLDNHSKKDAYL